jgi:hypothetical protein
MKDKMFSTLFKYYLQHSNKHVENNESCHVVQGLNFVECLTCKDHAHYIRPGIMLQHNSDYSIRNKIKLF